MEKKKKKKKKKKRKKWKNKNKEGKVIKIIKKKYRAIVKGINIITKYIKPSSKEPKGKIKKIESSVHISNIKKII
jgi:large subunit ribosomal protein L24